MKPRKRRESVWSSVEVKLCVSVAPCSDVRFCAFPSGPGTCVPFLFLFRMPSYAAIPALMCCMRFSALFLLCCGVNSSWVRLKIRSFDSFSSCFFLALSCDISCTLYCAGIISLISFIVLSFRLCLQGRVWRGNSR